MSNRNHNTQRLMVAFMLVTCTLLMKEYTYIDVIVICMHNGPEFLANFYPCIYMKYP